MNTLIEQYAAVINSSIDDEGVYPTPAIFQYADGKQELFSYAIEGTDMLNAACDTCRQKDAPVEAIFGLDIWLRVNHDTTLDSAVIVFHVTPGACALGVLEYTWDEEELGAITKPINWENSFWIERYKRLCAEMKTWIKEQ